MDKIVKKLAVHFMVNDDTGDVIVSVSVEIKLLSL